MIALLATIVFFPTIAHSLGILTIGDHVILAGMTAVHQFCSVGSHSLSLVDRWFEKMSHLLSKLHVNPSLM